MALDKPLDELTETDLQNLVTNEVAEGITLEYKEALPLDTSEERKEFLRDVSAFANTRGGEIIYGIREDRDRGVPKEACGIPVPNWDLLRQRIENLIRDGTNPRVYGVQIPRGPISLRESNFAVVIRIPRSFNAPHMVVSGGDDRFYYRTSAGRARLDVTGLRTLFGLTDTVASRTRDFRAERLNKIQGGDTPVQLMQGLRYVLHMIPFDAFVPGSRHDLSGFVGRQPAALLPHVRPQHVDPACRDSRYNLDGVVSNSIGGHYSGPFDWYTQCFRNGILEAVSVNRDGSDGPGRLLIKEFEEHMSKGATESLKVQRDMGVAPPIFALLTLLGAKGCTLAYRDAASPGVVADLAGGGAFKEEHLVLPEVLFEDFECDVSKQMEPAFEIVWNAAGLPRRDPSPE